MKKPIAYSMGIHIALILVLTVFMLIAKKTTPTPDPVMTIDMGGPPPVDEPKPKEIKPVPPPLKQDDLAEKVVKKIEEPQPQPTPQPQQPTNNTTQSTSASLSGGYQVIPKYPEMLRRREVEGVVILRVEVLPNGSVGNIEIVKSGGYEAFDRSAVDAVRQWHFNPAIQFGTAVTSWVKLPVKFTLK